MMPSGSSRCCYTHTDLPSSRQKWVCGTECRGSVGAGEHGDFVGAGELGVTLIWLPQSGLHEAVVHKGVGKQCMRVPATRLEL